MDDDVFWLFVIVESMTALVVPAVGQALILVVAGVLAVAAHHEEHRVAPCPVIADLQ